MWTVLRGKQIKFLITSKQRRNTKAVFIVRASAMRSNSGQSLGFGTWRLMVDTAERHCLL
jgi:hypothetical protein